MTAQPNEPRCGRDHVLKTLGVTRGDLLELEEAADGSVLRARRLDPSLLAPLHGKIRPGVPPFYVGAFRRQPCKPSLRD